MRDAVKMCRKCGKPIGIIERGLYRKIVVNASPVEVFPDENGETFIRLDGSKVKAVLADRWDDNRTEAEYVFRPHRC